MSYPHTQLLIAGQWQDAADGRTLAVHNPATGQEKVVIVLGAGLRKDRPSLLLRYRLDKAYEYTVAHPDALVITTGGQGRDEWVPEGQAMRNYLIETGLSDHGL